MIASACMCSCVSQNIPAHGGGKRLFYEQALISKAVDSAIDQLDLDEVKADLEASDTRNAVEVYVIAMGDEGGGAGSEPSLFGALFSRPAANQPSVAVGGHSGSSSTHAFSNARDIEYIRGKVLQSLAGSGVPIATEQADTNGKLYLLVSEFGTAKETFQLILYSESKLTARAAMEAFYVTPGPAGSLNEFSSLGKGECTTEYLARYVFGSGPIHGIQIEVRPGPIPANVVWKEPKPAGNGEQE